MNPNRIHFLSFIHQFIAFSIVLLSGANASAQSSNPLKCIVEDTLGNFNSFTYPIPGDVLIIAADGSDLNRDILIFENGTPYPSSIAMHGIPQEVKRPFVKFLRVAEANGPIRTRIVLDRNNILRIMQLDLNLPDWRVSECILQCEEVAL